MPFAGFRAKGLQKLISLFRVQQSQLDIADAAHISGEYSRAVS